MRTFSHPELERPFSVKVPEVYQIEITDNCNLSCPGCPRDLLVYRREKPNRYIEPALIEKMCHRGDLAGSYFVELQGAGEPLMHNSISDIIDVLHKKLKEHSFAFPNLRCRREERTFLQVCCGVNFLNGYSVHVYYIDCVDPSVPDFVKSNGGIPVVEVAESFEVFQLF